MKVLTILFLLALGNFAPAQAPAGEALHFTGQILQHGRDGLWIRCTGWKPYLNKGHQAEELTGNFLLTGSPYEATLPDGRAIEFAAVPDGLVKVPTLYQGTQTITRLVYLSPTQAPARATPKFGNTMLDKPSRR